MLSVKVFIWTWQIVFVLIYVIRLVSSPIHLDGDDFVELEVCSKSTNVCTELCEYADTESDLNV